MTILNLTIIFALTLHANAEDSTDTETAEATFIDFEELELTAEMVKPSAILVPADRQPAKPDLLIPDVRQLFLDKQAAERARASK